MIKFISSKKSFQKKRILLGQLMRAGDCVFLTAIARQIKHDYPDCHFTWAIGSPYSSLLVNNPHVDSIWEIPLHDDNCIDVWNDFEQQAKDRHKRGEFDEIFLTQIPPNNWQNFDGTTRVSMFRGYPHSITESVVPVLHLLQNEVEKVKKFSIMHKLQTKKNVILFEFSPGSKQSFVTTDFAIDLSKQIVANWPDTVVILSSSEKLETKDKRLIDGSIFSFRENAELTKYCSLLIGCSSGISWLCTSNWAKKLPMIQLLSKEASVYASFTHDHEYWGLSTEHIIELTDCSVQHVYDCVITALNSTFSVAKVKFHEKLNINYNFYCDFLLSNTWQKRKYLKFLTSLFNVTKRYGLSYELLNILRLRLFPLTGIKRKLHRLKLLLSILF